MKESPPTTHMFLFVTSMLHRVPQSTQNVHAHKVFIIRGASDDLLQQIRFHDELEVTLVVVAHVVGKVQIRLHIAEHGTNGATRVDSGSGISAVKLFSERDHKQRLRKAVPCSSESAPLPASHSCRICSSYLPSYELPFPSCVSVDHRCRQKQLLFLALAQHEHRPQRMCCRTHTVIQTAGRREMSGRWKHMKCSVNQIMPER